LARDEVDAIDVELAEQLLRLVEFRRLGQVRDVAGMNDELRALRQSIYVRDGAAQRADHVGICLLVESKVCGADLYEGDWAFRGARGVRLVGPAERRRYAAGHAPENPRARPCRKARERGTSGQNGSVCVAALGRGVGVIAHLVILLAG